MELIEGWGYVFLFIASLFRRRKEARVRDNLAVVGYLVVSEDQTI
jgi:hypothetical protein